MVASEKLLWFGLQRNVMVIWDLRWFQNRPFVETGIRTNFARGTRNTAQGIRNLTNDWNPAPVLRNPRCLLIHWFRSDGVNH